MVEASVLVGGSILLISFLALFFLLRQFRRLRAEKRDIEQKIQALEQEIVDLPEDEQP